MQPDDFYRVDRLAWFCLAPRNELLRIERHNKLVKLVLFLPFGKNTYLFSRREHYMVSDGSAFALSREEGTSVWFVGSLITVKATDENTQGSFSLIEQVAPPDYGPPWHVHHEDEELVYVIEGEATVFVGDETMEAASGTMVYLPHGVPHSYRIEGEQPARLIVMTFKPGFEQYFIEGGEPAKELTLPPSEPPSEEKIEQLSELAPQYGYEILGPPPWQLE